MMDGTLVPAGSSLAQWVPRRKLDVDQFHRMTAAGILHEDDPVELIDGQLIEMAAIGGPHIGTVMALTRLLVPASVGRAAVSIQSSVRLDRYNEPEPDVALLRLRADDYRGASPPTAADVLLLIEVADSTQRYDKLVKAPLYARHAIPHYWLVDLNSRTVLVHSDPRDGGYPAPREAPPGERLDVPGLPGAALEVLAIVGPAS